MFEHLKENKILVFGFIACLILASYVSQKKELDAEEAAKAAAAENQIVSESAIESPAETDIVTESEPEDDEAVSEAVAEPTAVEIAATMQDYSHAPGEDAEPITVVDDNILLLVNKTHPLSKDYKASDMVTVSRYDSAIGSAETHQMRAVAAEAFEKLMDGAEEAGYTIVLRTGYRSYDYQRTLFDNYAKNNGVEAANTYSALPGESEHQTGLCCDVGIPGVGLTSFNGTDEADWIAENAHLYGFILRYPENKTDITGYMYESWHIRYVGTECAAEIYANNQTLEEYLGVLD